MRVRRARDKRTAPTHVNRSVYLIPVLLDRLDVAVGRTAERGFCGWRLVDDDGERSVRRAGAARRMLGGERLFRDLRLGLAAVDSGGGGGWWLVVGGWWSPSSWRYVE